MITLSTDQVRSLLQMPERPYQDTRFYNGDRFYDLERYEVVRVLNVSGTVSGSAHLFSLNTDFAINYDSIDWSVGMIKPDINTAFTTEYTYSRLGSSLASTACQNAIYVTTFDLGSSYPYGSTSVEGINTDKLASFVCAFRACAEACRGLSASEIELAQKIRRGSVLFDDSKKTSDWLDESCKWSDLYKQYLSIVRPLGMIRGFQLSRSTINNMVLGGISKEVFDGLGFGPFGGF
jgi:hypothetical protein